jgi:hypothetical protein
MIATAPPASVTTEPQFHAGRGTWDKLPVDQSWFAEPEPFTDHPSWSTAEEGEALLARDGYLVIPELFSPDEVERLYEHAVHGGKPDAEYEVKHWCFNKYLGLDYQHDASWMWVTDKDRALEQLDRLMGSDCHCYDAGLWVTGPGRKMGYHVDLRAIDLPPDASLPPEIPMPCFGAVFIAALDDQVMEQGPTVVVPGSHLRAPGPRQAPLRSRALLMKRGDGLILRLDTCHGAAANVGPRRRYHLHCNWGSANRPMAAPMSRPDLWDPAVIASATPRQRRVHGGEVHGEHIAGREARWRALMGLSPKPV